MSIASISVTTFSSCARVGALALLGLASLASAAFAQVRPSTADMTCAQAQATVQRAGAILLSTGVHSFDRFVRDQSFCKTDEMTVPTWARTRDNSMCMVGDRCESISGRAPTPR